jgi:hypothetical protein
MAVCSGYAVKSNPRQGMGKGKQRRSIFTAVSKNLLISALSPAHAL